MASHGRADAVEEACAEERPVSRRILQACLWVAAGACWFWAYADPGFRDAEGFLRTPVCLPLAIGAGLAIIALGTATRLQAAACWAGLVIIGQGAALQLIDAGPYMRYQHYEPLDRILVDAPVLALLCLGAQTALVVSGIRARWPIIWAWLRSRYASWQLVGLALFFFLFSATVSADPRRYAIELVFASFVQVISLGNVVLLAWSLPTQAFRGLWARLDRFLDGPVASGNDPQPGVDRLAMAGGFWVATLAAVLSFFVYENHPHIPDEVVYLYQARYLASGTLTMPAPAVPEGFDVYLMRVHGNQWYPTPPAGWPALLAIGTVLGVPWLINPLLAGLNVVLAFSLVRKLYDRRTARASVLLLCVSPWNVFMGMNFMTHTSSLTCALLAALGLIRARERRRAVWAAAAGVAVGMLSLIRPLEGLVLAGLLGLCALGMGGSRLKLASIGAFILATAGTAATVLPYNEILTGDAAVFPIMAYTDERFGVGSNAYGFGANRGMGWPIDPFPGHGVVDALINSDLNVFSSNVELFGWSIGSLALVLIFVVSRGARKRDVPMFAVIIALFVAHFFYYFSGGPDFGARYWFLMLVPFVALTARAMHLVGSDLGASTAAAGDARCRITVAVIVLCASSLITFFPWRAIDKYHHYLGMRPDLRYLDALHHFGESLVLIRGDAHPDYASAAAYNPLDLRAAKPVYAWDRNQDVRNQLLESYADRPVWLIDGPTRTHGPYRVVAGPFPARDFAARIAALASFDEGDPVGDRSAGFPSGGHATVGVPAAEAVGHDRPQPARTREDARNG